MYSSEEAWRRSSRAKACRPRYLWLGDTAMASHATWAQFAGVYRFCPVRDKKAGATCWPASAIPAPRQTASSRSTWRCIATALAGGLSRQRGDLAAAAAESGLVRDALDQAIRYAAQEHLRRQSARGSLVVDHDRYQVGSTVEVRAELKNADCVR